MKLHDVFLQNKQKKEAGEITEQFSDIDSETTAGALLV